MRKAKAMQIENCKLEIANCSSRIASSSDFPLVKNRRNASLASGVSSRAAKIFTFQFSLFNFQFLSIFALCSLLLALSSAAQAQTIADKTVATVSTGARSTPDLITYSDLVWQLALEPDRRFSEPPSSLELNQALRTLQNQLLILQEARKLPLAQTAEAQQEFEKTVSDMQKELVQGFGSRARLEERMSRVGLTSARLDAILRDRAMIERYLDFRFRAFVLVSSQEIADRYESIYRPVRNSGKVVPTLEQARDDIERRITNEKIAEEIGKFVDTLREQPGTEIVVLNPV